MFSSKTGARVPRPSSIDSNEDREMDFDDHRDYVNQDIPGNFLLDTSLLLILDQFIIS
jgi:hypothetical protein